MSTASSQQSSQHSLEDTHHQTLHNKLLNESRKYILLKEHTAKSKRGVNSTSKPRLTSKKDDTRVCRGSLWEERDVLSPTTSNSSTGSNLMKSTVTSPVRKHEFDSIEIEDVTLHCPMNMLNKISEEDCKLLLAIPVCEDRYKVYSDKERMATAQFINVGSEVIVEKRALSPCRGRVRWKGRIAGKQGIWFGIEITDENKLGKGETDGCINKIRLFDCGDKNGAFANISNINLIPPQKPMRKLKKHYPPPPIPSHNNNNMRTLTNGITPTDSSDISSSEDYNHRPPSDLRVNERVIWHGGNGWEKAVVRWIGTLPADENTQQGEVLVGVEFDNPVGRGTGLYKNTRLFSAKKNHASLVPLEGLFREDDVLTDIDDTDFNASVAEDEDDDDSCVLRATTDISITHQPTAEGVLNELGLDSDTDMASRPVKPKQFSNKAHIPNGVVNVPPATGSRSNSAHTSTSSMDNTGVHMQVRGSSCGPVSAQRNRSMQSSRLYGKSSSPKSNRSTGTLSDNNTSPVHQKYGSSHQRSGSSSSNNSSQNGYQLPNGHPSPIQNPEYNRTFHDNGYHRTPAMNLKAIRETPPGGIAEEDMVVIPLKIHPLYGVVKWIGRFPNSDKDSEMYIAGVEVEEENDSCTYGIYRGLQLLDSPKKNIMFMRLSFLQRDDRFPVHDTPVRAGATTCIVPGHHQPSGDMNMILGSNKGVQGDHNSCYMDASLFSMFSFSTVFDTLLDQRPRKGDVNDFTVIQETLHFHIVNPLRSHGKVEAVAVHKLRECLDKLGEVKGLKGDEKDPEEFLGLLFDKVFHLKPLIELSNGQDCNIFHLFGERDSRITFPTVQKLLETSCSQEKIRFKRVPSCMIMHMPRYGKDFKLYDKIFPSSVLDVTDLLEGAVRQCAVCGGPAVLECPECYEAEGELRKCTHCNDCSLTVHKHPKRKHHMPVLLGNNTSDSMADTMTNSVTQGSERSLLELFAIMCIEKSHYVTFCKVHCQGSSTRSDGTEDDPWVFFDSMADREGGVNIPEVKECHLSKWLSHEGYEDIARGQSTSPHVERLLKDVYICFYRNPEQSLFS